MFLSLGRDLDRIAVLDLGDGAAVADDVAGVIATVIPKGTGRGRLPQRAVAEENLAAVPILGGGVTAGQVDKVGAVLLVVALDDVVGMVGGEADADRAVSFANPYPPKESLDRKRGVEGKSV